MDTTPMKSERLRQGLTLMELSDKTGIPFSTLRYIETGKREPGLLPAFTIAKALGKKAEDLFIKGMHKKI